MTRPQKRNAIASYALAFAIAIAALIVVSLVGMSRADAGGYRQRAVCAPQVYQQAAVVAYPGVVGYQVGQALQQQSVDEYGFRASPSQQRLTFLEGYYQAKQEESQQPEPQEVQVPESGTCPDCEKPAEPQAFSVPQTYDEATGIPQPTPEQEALVLSRASGMPVQITQQRVPVGPPAPPVESEIATGFAATFPRWQAVCAGCHSGQEPKGDVDIANAVHQAFAEDSCEAREHFARLVADGEMPKGKPLDDAAKGALLLELYRSK